MRQILVGLIIVFFWHIGSIVQGQIVINEFMADNQAAIPDPDFGKYADWIELYNSGSSSVDISGYALTDDPTILNKWIFPSGTTIPSSGFLLIWADKDDTGLHTNFGLGKAGETIVLSDKSLVELDAFTYSEQIEDVSYGRVQDGGNEWAYFTIISPGSSNSVGAGDLIASKPVFSIQSGFYSGSQEVTIEAQSSNAKIYYTLDGSDPDTNSKRYRNPIGIDTTSIIRAIQVEEGYLDSPDATRTYLIDENTSLPVFSIVTDPKNLWDQDSGIYVEGRDYSWAWFAGNFWQDWERPCFVEFWEADRDQKISQGAALKITGALTRTASQKSLRIIAKSEYGAKKFSYRFFKDKSISEFNDIVLRSSGNDWGRTMFADGMMATIVAGQMDIDYNAYRPAILFLNGQYWGIHNIREKVGDDYIEENHGFNKDNIDFLSQLSDIREGDRVAYNSILNYIISNDLNDPEKFSYVEERIDIQEFINYFVAQTFYANHDWPAGNIKYWRPKQETSQWRWILFDTDLAFQQFYKNTIEHITDTEPFYEGANDLFNGLMASREFSDRFVNTYQYHMASTFEPERLLKIIDSLQIAIQPEIGRHIDKWQGYHGWTYLSSDNVFTIQPCLKSYSDWLDYVDDFRIFARNRASDLNNYFSAHFGFGDAVEVTLSVENQETGKVWINEDKATSGFMNFVFFEDQLVTIQPLANLNYVFDEWVLETNFSSGSGESDLISKKSTWLYLDNGQYPGSNWINKSFDDSGWERGDGPLGYNYAGANTVIGYGGDKENKHISYWFRHKFSIVNSDDWKNLKILLLRDDGAIIWLNGTEIIRSNMDDNADYNSTASNGVDSSEEDTYFPFQLSANLLVDGINTIAVELHQISKTSSDLSFDLELSGVTDKDLGETSIIQDEIISKTFTEKSHYMAKFIQADVDIEVKINEVMSDNKNLITTSYGKTPDWIEFYNPNDFAVDLGGLYITDDLLKPDKFQISTENPELTIIPANGFRVLIADGDRLMNAKYVDIQLSTDGEEVGLYQKVDDNFYLIDSLFFPALMPDASFGRYPDGSDEWYLFSQSPTPEEPNKKSDQVVPDRQVALLQNYPNPFKEKTSVLFNLQVSTHIRIDIVDIYGRLVKQVTNREWETGLHSIEWNARNDNNASLQPGVYICVLYSGVYHQSNKMILIR